MNLDRRQVLRGLAGFTLALPVLPSLLSRSARAANVVPQRFIAFATQHGGVWQPRLYPADSTLTHARDHGGHAVRRGDLVSSVGGSNRAISAVLSAAQTTLTADLVAKMNVMRGLDVPFYLGHHRGGHLGNYAENDANGSDSATMQGTPRPTIDQVLAWAPEFYGESPAILERSLVIGGRGMSSGWSNPQQGTGTIQRMANQTDSLALFRRIFRADAPSGREPVVDLVIEDYRRLSSSSRIAQADRQRLEEHMQRLFELERKLQAQPSCGELREPSIGTIELIQTGDYHRNPSRQRQAWQLFNDVIVAALICDSSRVITCNVNDTFSDYAGDWHQEIAHQANHPTWTAPPATDGPHPHELIATSYQRFFSGVFVDLIRKLDQVPDGQGGTLLDACLVQWTQESGPVTHSPIDLPVVTAGGACGRVKTGQYLDYRNLNSPAHRRGSDSQVQTHTGLIYNQWLGNVLRVMGMPRHRFERDGVGGYGVLQRGTETWYAGYNKYSDTVFSAMGDDLPWCLT